MENNEEKTKEVRSEAPENLTPNEAAGTVVKKKKGKRDFYVEIVLFFVLGILIGVAVKTEAVKRITIGFDDYKMRIGKQDYNINQIESDLAEGQAEEARNSEAEMENQPEEGTNDEPSL